MHLRQFIHLVRFRETLFGLPLALTGALLPMAYSGLHLSLVHLWIFPAFAAARISGMAFNRLIDRHIDAKNPRTQGRLVPSGQISALSVAWVAWGALALFFLSAFFLGTACFLLSFPVACLLVGYSYMKRIHASCHFVLGLIHFFSPVMASVAVTGRFTLAPCFLGLTAFFSIAASDILYAFQDLAFDRAAGIHSLPAKLGTRASALWMYSLRVCSVGALTLVGVSGHLGLIFYLAPLSCAFLFFGTAGRFFAQNALASALIMLFTLVDLWVGMS